MLTLKVRLGDDVYIGDEQVIAHRIEDDAMVVLTKDEEVFVPFGPQGVELWPNVRLYSDRDEDPHVYCLGFDAPRDILILTGRNYRKSLDG